MSNKTRCVKSHYQSIANIFLLVVFFSSVVFASDNYIQDAKQYLNTRDYKSAIIQLKNALQEQPESHEARYLLGKIYAEIGDGPSAEKELSLARQYGSKETSLPVLLGRAYLIQKKTESVFQNIKIEPDMSAGIQADIHTLYGNAYLMQGKKTEASDAYKNALVKVENHVDAIIGNAKINLINKEYKEAEQLLEKVISMTPDRIDALLLLAEIKKLNMELPEARKNYDLILPIQ